MLDLIIRGGQAVTPWGVVDGDGNFVVSQGGVDGLDSMRQTLSDTNENAERFLVSYPGTAAYSLIPVYPYLR